ncbi:porin [Cupriavidus sp. SK-4]|uniref:porin n=1 Tax=Cupriavidus sp. SK-4 TaxID=574750 RepID=UPI00044E3AB9|nr:porin [Cupriavidus sp. SK-4]EYS84954.1 porin [Cupriavidus sp. SK-4]
METTSSRIAIGIAAIGVVVSTQVFAQGSTVNLYGVMDTGVEFLSHAGNGGSGSQYRMSAGNVAGSRWGLRGMEDLGGGNSVLFAIEGGVFGDTGVSAQGGRLFGRQSFVGLAGAWGTLTAGRQINTLFSLFVPFDPLQYATYGLLAHDVTFSMRADNSLKYTKDVDNLTVTAQYSFGYDGAIANGGEVPGSYRIGQELGTGASYTVGNLGMAAAYTQRRGTTAPSQDNIERRYAAGLLWSSGSFSAMLGYRLLQGTVANPSLRTNLYWAGAAYKLAPAFTFRGGVYHSDQRHSGNDATSYSLAALYALSKRTELYLLASYMDNKGASALSAATASTVAPGVNQNGVVAGIKHIF